MKQESTVKEYFTFLIHGESYGVQIESVSQITGLQAITRVPGQKRHVKGVMNLRGQIIPVIDLGKRLTGVDVLADEHSSIVIASMDGDLIGMIVERVSEVIKFDVNEITVLADRNKKENRAPIFGLVKKGKEETRLIDMKVLVQ